MKENSQPPAASRRKFLQTALAIIPSTALATSVVPAALAAEQTKNPTRDYVPVFFKDDEWRFIIAATDVLIPGDEYGPGAVSEGVPVFIDRQMEMPYGYGQLWYMKPPFQEGSPLLGYQKNLTPRDIYRRGIAALNKACQTTYQHPFASLATADKVQVMEDLESGKLVTEDVDGKLFFAQLLENTKEGYLADPIHGGNQTMASWKMIGFPGARADYVQVMDNPGKPYLPGPVSISGKYGA
ncbi:gluconate 2-dehydrogenase subunit 3 family protein [Tatumella citrea]|uniref:Gluconate 2-dehydrogenase n=1 Tax=Tatumella citrea TaxID=53336 RepID=A0A1Y0LA05_TATCI|nr:gluconate 2-dehydrogenase subunit 3 family protein [Tatumella citrea]ARU94530.1 gluconate 2-dehydrogenase [Tatumella citrea]ARU98568.1 gluconate 2-dehydrogenase [Tatumella citrea]